MPADPIQPVNSPFLGVGRAGQQGQKKKEQPPFDLGRQKGEGEEPAAGGQPPKTESAGGPELEVAPPKEGEVGNKLNVVA